MKDEVKREQHNGRDSKSKSDKKYSGRSPSRRDRSRSPVDRRGSKDPGKASRRVYFANVSFDTHWTEVKDFFRDKIGDVAYCTLFEDEGGRSRGCGLIEFNNTASAKKAIDELHRYDFKGRELVVKEDIDCERDRFGRLVTGRKEKDRDSVSGGGDNRHNRSIYDPMRQTYSNSFNTYGLSPQFLESLNISGPLNNRIFVANLDYKVGEKKLEEIFRLAGKVLRVRLYTDQGGTSKGHGTVEFEHPVEAVQAISMFHDQNLYGRAMSIRMDKYETEEMPEVLPSKLPSGLESIGKGLGVGGQPLNIGKSLMNASMSTQSTSSGVSAQANPVALTTPQNVVPAPAAVVQPQVNSYNLTGLTSALGQQNVGLNTPQVNQALNSLALHNLSASSLSSLGNQNLTQLASTAQNVLQNVAAAASFGSAPLNPSSLQGLSSVGQPNSMFTNYERDYQSDKFRNGSLGQVQNQVQSGTLKVLVRNIPSSFNWQNLKDRFSDFGDVEDVQWFQNRSMAVVTYRNYNDAAKAVQLMNNLRIADRVIQVELYYQ